MAAVQETIEQVYHHHEEWRRDYVYNLHTNEYTCNHDPSYETQLVDGWFSKELL